MKIVVVLTVLLTLTCLTVTTYAQQELPETVCIDDFESFAYRAHERDLTQLDLSLLSMRDWSATLIVPPELLPVIPNVETSPVRIAVSPRVSRMYNNQHELWIWVGVYARDFRETLLFIYRPFLNQWETISSNVFDSNVNLSTLFVSPDGSVWASNQWLDNALPDASSVPALSRFNETNRRFEYVLNSPHVPVVDRRSINANLRQQVILDQDGIFWVFNVNNSIYRYDPASDVSEQRLDITAAAPRGIDYAVLAPDGTLYFSPYVGVGLPDLSDDAIFQYNPQTHQLVSIPLPQEPWPQFTSLFVDSRNWLWLGANGYRDESGVWHLRHTAAEEYLESQGYRHQAPNIFSETSDGRLWTNRFEFNEGTAWFNPVTGEGCQITASLNTVFEDIEGYVWIGAGTEGQLYRYQAVPSQ